MLVGAYGTAITVDQGGSLWLGLVVGLAAAVRARLAARPPDPAAAGRLPRHRHHRRGGDPPPVCVRSSRAEPVTGGVFGIQGFADAFFDLNPFDRGRCTASGPFSVTERQLWVMVVGWALVALLTSCSCER